MTQMALHAAIIMDGNGRWATARGLPRLAGHRAGAKAVRRVVERAPSAGIAMLTHYAFSSDNWARPETEVTGLMRLFERYLRGETARCVAEGVRSGGATGWHFGWYARSKRPSRRLREGVRCS